MCQLPNVITVRFKLKKYSSQRKPRIALFRFIKTVVVELDRIYVSKTYLEIIHVYLHKHIALSLKNCENIELGKNNRLKALYMM